MINLYLNQNLHMESRLSFQNAISLKSIIMFVICNYMTEILHINMWKVYVNYKTLFIELQCYTFMSRAQIS